MGLGGGIKRKHRRRKKLGKLPPLVGDGKHDVFRWNPHEGQMLMCTCCDESTNRTERERES